MSTTASRRRRLAVAKTLPQAYCEQCGTRLDRVSFPLQHLERCERIAAVRAAAATLPDPDPRPGRPSLLQRLAGVLGMTTRGAAE